MKRKKLTALVLFMIWNTSHEIFNFCCWTVTTLYLSSTFVISINPLIWNTTSWLIFIFFRNYSCSINSEHRERRKRPTNSITCTMKQILVLTPFVGSSVSCQKVLASNLNSVCFACCLTIMYIFFRLSEMSCCYVRDKTLIRNG